MSAIRGHRSSLYKMGIYIKVFFEGEESGAMWHKRLEKYQVYVKGESNDSVPYFTWVISAISYSFFVFSLTQLQKVNSYHFYLPLIAFAPILIFQHIKHNEMRDISKMEDAWRKVSDEEKIRDEIA